MVVLSHIIFVVIFLLKNVFTANILYVAPLASPSHYIWNKAFALALVERGHNVTILTHDTEKQVVPKNFTVITMEGFYEIVHDGFDFDAAMHESTLSTIIALYDFIKFSCEYDLDTKGLETLLNYPKNFKFDLIIFDVTFGQCLYPLIDRFNKPPVVAVTAFLLPPYLSHAFGNHLYTSYIPHYNSGFDNKMSFIERVKNFIYINLELLYRNYISASTEYKLGKKRFGDNIRRPEDVERSMSILLANTDPVLDNPVALPPNIIPIGGLHIKPTGTLPKDLKEIMDKAKHGVILFSLGTNIHFEMLRQEQRQAFLGALGRFPQTILWKIVSDHVEGLPKNVIMRKWLPQNEILERPYINATTMTIVTSISLNNTWRISYFTEASSLNLRGHPNIRLFITHGGALSTQEAMYHGVPVVAVPFIVDQYVNARTLVQRNLGKCLDHANLTSDNVFEAVQEVLNNPVYRQNMKIISGRYRDQPQTPLQRGIFWAEYILRHGSAEHLVLPARDMPFYQTSNSDVIAVFVAGLLLAYNLMILLLAVCRFGFTFRRCDAKPKKSK